MIKKKIKRITVSELLNVKHEKNEKKKVFVMGDIKTKTEAKEFVANIIKIVEGENEERIINNG